MEPINIKKRPYSNQKNEKMEKEPLENKCTKKSKIKMKKDTFGCSKGGACPKCGCFHFNCFCCYGSCPIHGHPMMNNNLNKITENNNINNINNVNNFNNLKNINDISFY